MSGDGRDSARPAESGAGTMLIECSHDGKATLTVEWADEAKTVRVIGTASARGLVLWLRDALASGLLPGGATVTLDLSPLATGRPLVPIEELTSAIEWTAAMLRHQAGARPSSRTRVDPSRN
ncbi:MAG: hypothetical protein IH945_02140 [Armatimonadetes bacterium]|nr:hypothetical protein [Armatimonadota bacterium]